MRERPILFSAPMVRAILAGNKTQTRRIVKPQPPSPKDVHALAGIDYSWIAPDRPGLDYHRPAGPVWAVRELMGREPQLRCPYGQPGDRLWVRETWAFGIHALAAKRDEDGPFVYAADGTTHGRLCERWRPSIHMPRHACRLMLEITAVRVERLNDISEADAKAEGCAPAWLDAEDNATVHAHVAPTYRQGFARLWRDINGAESWRSNPWVWVVEFRLFPHPEQHNDGGAA